MANGTTYGRFSGRGGGQAFKDVMSFAKQKGQEKSALDAILQFQTDTQKAEDKSEEVSDKKKWLKIGTSVLTSILLPIALTALSGGTSLLASGAQFLTGGAKGASIFSQMLGRGAMGGLKLGASKALSGGFADTFKLKQPEGPKVDVSKFSGPGQINELRNLLSQEQQVASQFSDVQKASGKLSLVDYILSVGSELASPIKGLGQEGSSFFKPVAPDASSMSTKDFLRNLYGFTKGE